MSARPYRSELREAQARATRARVLAAAAQVFLERGYGAATMREVAARAEVSVPTVELHFAKKAALLEAAIDVAIAGDDQPVGVLERDWARRAEELTDDAALAAVIGEVLTAAQVRSAGLVLALFEAARSDAMMAALAEDRAEQRARSAAWVIDRFRAIGPLRSGLSRQEAIDTLWALIDPALFDRLTRQRGWSAARYQRWISTTMLRLVRDGAVRPGGATPPPGSRSGDASSAPPTPRRTPRRKASPS